MIMKVIVVVVAMAMIFSSLGLSLLGIAAADHLPLPVFLPSTHSFFYFKFLFPRVLLHGINDLSLLSSSYDHSMMIVIINEV